MTPGDEDQHATPLGPHSGATRPDPPQGGQETDLEMSKQDYERLAELRSALRHFARHTELAARHVGVSPQQYLLMLNIKGFPGRDSANITELAERLQVRHNAVIGLINRAEQRGLVVRMQGGARGDRRVVYVGLTEAGERVLRTMAEALRTERVRVREALDAVQMLGGDVPGQNGTPPGR